MTDYSKGKIYMIYPTVQHDEGDIYIGSTTQSLSKRMAHHRCQCISSSILFDKYGVENCKIELIEYFACNTKEELNKKEGEHQRARPCVNIRIAGRTMKQHYEDNKDAILIHKKQYRIDNKAKVEEQKKQYIAANKEKVALRKHNYYLANKLKHANIEL